MQTYATSIQVKLRQQYPNIRTLQTLDALYELPESTKELSKWYDSFQRSMWRVNLTAWIKNKLDCDKWSILMMGHIILRNALSPFKNAQPIGLLLY